jgi:uncharacterized protein YfaS (alpha-2-macroglobulin family)
MKRAAHVFRQFIQFIFVFSLAMIATVGFAQEPGRYTAIEEITLGNLQIAAGTEVEILGIIDVDDAVSPSGKLATLRWDGKLYNTDFALFYLKEGASFDYRPLRFLTSNETASVCTTLFDANSRGNLDFSEIDFKQYIVVEGNSGNLVQFSVTRPNYFSSRSRESSDFCLNGLAYGSEFEVAFLKGMRGENSRGEFVLDKDIVLTVKTPDRAPSVSVWASQNILPTFDDAVLPVSTINVNQLDVIVHHVDLRSIANYHDVFSALNQSDINRLASFWGKEIGRRTLDLDFEKNSEATFNLNFSDLINTSEPGLFVLSFEFEGDTKGYWDNQATQWFMVSDVSAMLLHGFEYTDIFLNEFSTAQAMANASVEIVAANNRILATGVSDESGHVRFGNNLIDGTGGFRAKLLVVRHPDAGVTIWELDDLAKKPRALASGIEKADDRDVYLTASRDIFRGGDTVQVFGVARTLDLEALRAEGIEISLVRWDGITVFSESSVTDDNGAFRLDIPLKASALLGAYTLYASSMDEEVLAAHPIRVEDFVPLTIEPKINVAASGLTSGVPVQVKLGAEYFSGGPAAGLNAQVDVMLRRSSMPFGSKYEGFEFGMLGAQVPSDVSSQDLVLGDDGAAEFTFTPKSSEFDSAAYEYAFVGNVMDVGGRANRVETTVPLIAHERYLGLRALFGDRLEEGSSAEFEVVTLDRMGNEFPASEMTYTLSKVRYRYNWYWDDDEDYGWRYRRVRWSEQAIETGKFNTNSLQLKSALDWGVHEIAVTNASGFTTVSEFYVGWGGQSGPATEPEKLELAVVGDPNSAVVRFEAPFGGKLTLHTAASDILTTTTAMAEKGRNEFAVDLSGLPEPGGHLLATLIRPIETGSEHLPQVALGSVWIENLADDRRIETSFSMAEKLDSSQEVSVKIDVDQPSGTAVVFLVDEGIHAVTGFENFDLARHYFDPRALGLGFQSNFGRLINQDPSLPTFRVGGDEMGSTIAAEKSDFFKTYVEASPLLEIIDGKISYTFPDAGVEGRLRAVAFVSTPRGVGMSTKKVTVQDPVSLDISLPRFVAPGDRIGGKIAIRSNDFGGQFVLRKIVGGSVDETRISLAAGQNFTTTIPLSTSVEGRIPVTIEASYGDRDIRRDFEIVSRSSSYPLTELTTLRLERPNFLGWSRTRVPALPLEDFHSGDVFMTLSPHNGVNTAQILRALDRYPYGCIEQTSSTMRGLLARAEILGVNADLKKKIGAGVDRIIAKQDQSGAFGYWDRFSHVVDRYQPYAIETLIMALPYVDNREQITQAISRGLEYLYRSDFGDIDVQLYSYGLLARSGYEVTSRARYALDHELDLGSYSKRYKSYPRWATTEQLNRLSLAYWLASQMNDQARMERLDAELGKLLAKGDEIPLSSWELALSEPAVGLWNAGGSDRAQTKWWNSARDFGHFLTEIPSAHQTPNTSRIVEGTKLFLSGTTYRSTLHNSNLLRILEAQRAEVENLRVFLDGEAVNLGANAEIPVTAAQVANGFEIRHKGGQLNLVAEIVGPRASINSIDNGYIVTKSWYNRDGVPIDMGLSNQNGDAVISAKQGDLFTVVIEIDRSGKTEFGDLLLTDLLPSGFEIEDGIVTTPTFSDENGKRYELNFEDAQVPTFVQKMDDRFVAHFRGRWYSGDFGMLRYTVRAAYDTEAIVPDAHVEHMYAPQINGRSSVARVSVARQ